MRNSMRRALWREELSKLASAPEVQGYRVVESRLWLRGHDYKTATYQMLIIRQSSTITTWSRPELGGRRNAKREAARCGRGS